MSVIFNFAPQVTAIGLMKSNDISWLFFQDFNKSSNLKNSSSSNIPKDAEINIASELFTYKIASSTGEGSENQFLENNNPIVVIDEVYRPGKGVELKKEFYGIWREDINTEKKKMLQLIKAQFVIKYDLNDLSISSQHKTHPNLKHNMLITDNEKWERRKDLTGVLLKTVTNAVGNILDLMSLLIYYLLWISVC